MQSDNPASPVQSTPAPAPVQGSSVSNEAPEAAGPTRFRWDGHLGQMLMPIGDWILAEKYVRAIWDKLWPIRVEMLYIEGEQVLRILAYSELFRELRAGENVPPYEVKVRATDDGRMEVVAIEEQLPEESRIITPQQLQREGHISRQQRRALERAQAKQR